MRLRGVKGRQEVKFTIVMETNDDAEAYVRLLMKYGVPLSASGRAVTIADTLDINAPHIDVDVRGENDD